MRKSLGLYVVVDAEICHGQQTFDGTRIFDTGIRPLMRHGADEVRVDW